MSAKPSIRSPKVLPFEMLPHPHNMDVDAVITALKSSRHGLSPQEAQNRLQLVGPNAFPEVALPGFLMIFFRQFRSPMIYILLLAAVVSIVVQEYSDAVFIMLVLLVNAIIGSIQEHSAQQSATALRHLVTQVAHVEREDTLEINAETLVPGDIVLLESGDKVPADLRLISVNGLQIDESLLTGESMPVTKDCTVVLAKDLTTGDKINMAFSGTLVSRGRGVGIVVATALETQVGQIAEVVLTRHSAKPPLIIRLERFTFKITIALAITVMIMGAVTLAQGMPFVEVLLLSTALAVSAIPEGLPVALTVALSISMRRMAKRNVIARRLVTVEALGSCTYIATDKTGTLTVNELTTRKIVLFNDELLDVAGEGIIPIGEIRDETGKIIGTENEVLRRLATTAALANEGLLGKHNNEWLGHGDAVDVSMLVLAHKLNIIRQETLNQHPEVAFIPFESSNRFSASLNINNGRQQAHIKGAVERLLPMCNRMAGPLGDIPIDVAKVERLAVQLASNGYRVLALASGDVNLQENEVFSAEHLTGLSLLGLVGMIDPLRKEVKSAIDECYHAGLKVAMITGDHPATALAIARDLNLAQDTQDVVVGKQLIDAQEQGELKLDDLTRASHVFARIEPQQKLDIVQSLQRNGHFVAVTGDGANDAPALKVAHVGVAMGKKGTDVARETSDMIITDDNFTSIVAGIEEGRIAYANVRKVIFLLISTGAAEVVLFAMSLVMGLPLPLTAVQLLWLNLVTNGIQDVALAFEPGEGNELRMRPRSPQEPIFNRIMIERVVGSAVVMGVIAYAQFQYLILNGYSLDEARNIVLLLMVLFENVHVLNCRSERKSIFRMNHFHNPLLLYGTLTAQAIHIFAMYLPGISDVLKIQPVTFMQWFECLGVAALLLLFSELYKWSLQYRRDTII